ncbi:hypothetical protein ABIB30_005560, partial [Pedobacter sp. UYP1]
KLNNNLYFTSFQSSALILFSVSLPPKRDAKVGK